MKIKKNGEIVNLTESDLRRITEMVVGESDGFYEDEARFLARRLEASGEDIDTLLKNFSNGKGELNYMITKYLRDQRGSEIFDPRKRTPREIIIMVSDLNKMLNKLEEEIGNYKSLIRRSIQI